MMIESMYYLGEGAREGGSQAIKGGGGTQEGTEKEGGLDTKMPVIC